MAVAGNVAPFPRGAYDPSEVYEYLHAVTHNNRLWLCKLPNTVGIEPSVANSDRWFLALDGGLADTGSLGGETAAQWQKKIDDILNGTTPAGDTQMFGGFDISYFATAEALNDIVNGTTKIAEATNATTLGGKAESELSVASAASATNADNAETLDGKTASEFALLGEDANFSSVQVNGTDTQTDVVANPNLPSGTTATVQLPAGSGTLALTSDNITGNAATATNADMLDGHHSSDFVLVEGSSVEHADTADSVPWTGVTDIPDLEPALVATQTASMVTIEPSYEGAAEVDGLIHNEIPYPYVSTTSEAQGVSLTVNKDGSLTFNGTATDGNAFFIVTNQVQLKKGVTYTLSGALDSDSLLYLTNDSISFMDNGSGITFTPEEDVTVHLYFKVNNGVTYNKTIYPMLTKGTTPQPYVPYTYEVRSVGKQLLKYPYYNTSKDRNGISFVDNGDGTIGVSGTATSNAFFSLINSKCNLPVGENTISGLSNVYVEINTLDSENATIRSVAYKKNYNDSVTFNILETDINYNLNINIWVPNGASVNTTIEPMLVKGTVATPYEPYISDTQTVTPTTDKAYVKTYPGTTHIFTDYGIDLTAKYGATANGAKVYVGDYIKANGVENADKLDGLDSTAFAKLGENANFGVITLPNGRYVLCKPRVGTLSVPGLWFATPNSTDWGGFGAKADVNGNYEHLFMRADPTAWEANNSKGGVEVNATETRLYGTVKENGTALSAKYVQNYDAIDPAMIRKGSKWDIGYGFTVKVGPSLPGSTPSRDTYYLSVSNNDELCIGKQLGTNTTPTWTQFLSTTGTAAKATADANGANIASTYLKKTENATSATKLATARTVRTNLGSTSTASFDGSANITPGVTGTLPVANGGTGATTAAAALANLGTKPVVVATSAPSNTSAVWIS